MARTPSLNTAVSEWGSEPDVVIPLLSETLAVDTQQTETGALRVRILVEESVSQVSIEETFEKVTSTRVPRDVTVHSRREPWQDGDVLVIPIYEEVLVTERRIVLKEEIHITRRTHRTADAVELPVRRERAVIERRGLDGVWISEHVPTASS